jgi:membrane dipeptidase
MILAMVVASTTQAQISEAVKSALSEVPLIDGHNDLPWGIRTKHGGVLSKVDLHADLSNTDPSFHTDIPRLRAGMIGGQFWSVYVPAILPGARAVPAVMEQIDLTKQIIDAYPDTFELALTSEDVRRIHSEGKIASMMGIEGGNAIHNSLGVLRSFYDLGARYITLTHSVNLEWADSATDEPDHNGLTDFGKDIVREMNRIGMLVDLSHVSDDVMRDALEVAAAPVIFSHSSIRAVCDHPRNVPDDVLLKLKENGGVVMITFVGGYIDEEAKAWDDERRSIQDAIRANYPNDILKSMSEIDEWIAAHPAPETVTIAKVADHFDHVRNLIGVDYLGVGGDYDGTRLLPTGMKDVSGYPALFEELHSRGYTKEDLKKIAGENVLRVMKECEDFAAKK